MGPLRFEVAGCTIEMAAEEDLLCRLRHLYAGFPPGHPADPPNLRLHWTGDTCHPAVDGRQLAATRVADVSKRAAVTGSLLASLFTRLKPDNVILHGNALRSRMGSGVILLVGESGAGKTTLTRELFLPPGAEWEPVAEDVLIIDAENQQLHPYPRALSIRPENGTPGSAEKELHPHPGAPAGPVSLAKARVFILATEAPQSLPSSSFEEEFEHVWITHGGAALCEALQEAGLPLVDATPSDGLVCLRYLRRLDPPEKRLQASVLEQHAAMILATGPARSSEDAPRPRPSRPRLVPLPSGEGVRHCLPHIVRPTTEAALIPGGRHFLRLARAFQTAAFHLLIPGGSPRDTAWAIAEALIP